MKISHPIMLSSLILLAACAPGANRVAPVVYTIKPESFETEATGCKTGASLQIAEPVVYPGLDTRRIALLQEGKKFDYYNSVRWTAPVGEMLEPVLVEAFEQSGAFKSVTTELDSAVAEFTLLTDIRDYQVVRQNPAEVKIRLVSKLLDSRTRNVLVTIPAETTLQPDENKMDSIVETFNRGSAELASQIVAKSLNAIAGCAVKNKKKTIPVIRG